MVNEKVLKVYTFLNEKGELLYLYSTETYQLDHVNGMSLRYHILGVEESLPTIKDVNNTMRILQEGKNLIQIDINDPKFIALKQVAEKRKELDQKKKTITNHKSQQFKGKKFTKKEPFHSPQKRSRT